MACGWRCGTRRARGPKLWFSRPMASFSGRIPLRTRIRMRLRWTLACGVWSGVRIRGFWLLESMTGRWIWSMGRRYVLLCLVVWWIHVHVHGHGHGLNEGKFSVHTRARPGRPNVGQADREGRLYRTAVRPNPRNHRIRIGPQRVSHLPIHVQRREFQPRRRVDVFQSVRNHACHRRRWSPAHRLDVGYQRWQRQRQRQRGDTTARGRSHPKG